MTLDEILRREAAMRREVDESDLLSGARADVYRDLERFYCHYGPTLAAAARAGDRLYDYAHHASICTGDSTRPCDCGLVEALAAWDAVAAGREGRSS